MENLYVEGEAQEAATCKPSLQVRQGEFMGKLHKLTKRCLLLAELQEKCLVMVVGIYIANLYTRQDVQKSFYTVKINKV
jgi:hypothetical protein